MTELAEIYDTEMSWELGEGGQGSVCTVKKRSTGALFAMKTIDCEIGESLDAVLNEVEVHRRLDHPNIVRLYDIFVDESPASRRVCFVMDLCTGPTLIQSLNGRVTGEEGIAALVGKMLSAMRYCHLRGVVHSDIKHANFVFETVRQRSPSPRPARPLSARRPELQCVRHSGCAGCGDKAHRLRLGELVAGRGGDRGGGVQIC